MTIQQLNITVEGVNDSDLERGLEEVLRLVREGFTSGFNSNDTGAFNFESNQPDEPSLAWSPPPQTFGIWIAETDGWMTDKDAVILEFPTQEAATAHIAAQQPGWEHYDEALTVKPLDESDD